MRSSRAPHPSRKEAFGVPRRWDERTSDKLLLLCILLDRLVKSPVRSLPDTPRREPTEFRRWRLAAQAKCRVACTNSARARSTGTAAMEKIFRRRAARVLTARAGSPFSTTRSNRLAAAKHARSPRAHRDPAIAADGYSAWPHGRCHRPNLVEDTQIRENQAYKFKLCQGLQFP